MHRSVIFFVFLASCFYPLSTGAKDLVDKPPIISREQWGADESFLTQDPNGDVDVGVTDVGESGNTADRAEECQEWRRKYPNEFSIDRTVTVDENGERLRWAQQYSSMIRLLVVHHTALKVTGDDRSPAERMQALYQYHANQLGWGDIGYNYVVDEKGNIYEGRAGGDGVIGGHVYCSNVGTIGIALMGNFEEERPTQPQIKSLKWLLAYLAQENSINLNAKTRFHGVLTPTIVGHKDVGRTKCPGYYLKEILPQIRTHVIAGKLGSPISPPSLRFYSDGTSRRLAERLYVPEKREPTLEPMGPTELIGRPGGQLTIQVRYTAGDALVPRRARLVAVERSDPRIGIWQDFAGNDVRVRREILAPQSLRAGESIVIPLRIQLPRRTLMYDLSIGDIDFKLRAEGRRIPLPINSSASLSSEQESEEDTPVFVPAAAPNSSSIIPQSLARAEKLIRIRLSFDQPTATITSNVLPKINDRVLGGRSVSLRRDGDSCLAEVAGLRVSAPIVRIDAQSGVNTIASWSRATNRFRGVLECRIIDDQLVLINELSLEDYLKGLAEEPDSEPYEKQRAFAIAARSYAAYYLQPLHRKFPEMPYDGDDSPARFQSYGGVYFEEQNPRWVQAVESTAGKVVTKNGLLVKTPYFSADDGRTRSPEEVGWNRFPFEEIFESKPDPWCQGLPMNGHGVGMSGCGAKGQAKTGKTGEEIIQYYYEGIQIQQLQ